MNTKYLGLPQLIGQSKKRIFGYLKERASKRIQGWQAKLISQAGKTVLIRNVAQSIPVYTMSCFLLPKTLCQELENMFNKYWWRSGTGGNKGINWLSWNNMSMSKNKQGLGFKNLYDFNIALLGKHCWNSLLYQVNIAITCPMCNNGIEHLLHIFFDCYFAAQCWNHVHLSCCDMREVDHAPDWLLNKLGEAHY